MKAYLISSAAFAVATVLVASSGGPPLIAIGCLAFSLASIMAHRVETGIARENKEFTRWKR